jgi:RNA polymerase sigma-70 factor (ECF subfamily)
VHGILLARVRRDEVEDLMQQVFLAALEHLPSLRDPRAFGAWLTVIARRHAADHLRRTPLTTELPGGLAAAGSDPTSALSVLEVIRRLPDAYRETLTLRLVEEMTGPEIAAATGLTEGSVRVNLHRGMKQLREQLRETHA